MAHVNGTKSVTTRLPETLIRDLKTAAVREGVKLEEYIRRVLIAGRDALRAKKEAQ